MNGQPSPVPPNQKTRCLKIIALIFIGLLVLYLVYRQILARSIQARIDAIHQAGFPATCTELDKWYVQPPAGQNAADVYSNAFAYYQLWTNKEIRFSVPVDAADTNKYFSPPKSKRDLLPIVGMARLSRTEPLSSETQKVLAEYLSDNAESLRLLHEANLMKSCRYPVDLTKGVMMSLRHLNSIRQAARLLELERIRYTDEQQPQLAVESVVASLGVSRSLDQEPVIISYLVRLACQGMALDSLNHVLDRMSLTDAQLAKLTISVSELENRQALTRAFVGDCCEKVDTFQSLRSGKIPLQDIPSMGNEESIWPRFVIGGYGVTGLLELDERDCLDLMQRYVKAVQLLPPESIAASRAVDDPVEHLSRWRVLSRMMLPALGPMLKTAALYDAKTRDSQVALALERYRLANGKLPSQLSDLVPNFLPTVPSDPFDGKPLRYKTLAKGYVVYSVGDDREDNGGTEKNNKGLSYVSGTDITFTVER